jgi:hypothetical protein
MSKGYDNLPIYFQCLLDAPMFEGVGAWTNDIARAAAFNHRMGVYGAPTWTQAPLANLTYLDFVPANPSRLVIAAIDSADMAFTVSPFSGVAWIHPTLLVGASRTIFSKWTATVSGWLFNVLATGVIDFFTVQAGAFQSSQSAAGEVVINTWYLVGFTRSGASGRIFKNGVDVTSVAAAHVNPVADAGIFYIGADSAMAEAFSGGIWRPRVWSRQLSAFEMLEIFEQERGLFGV